MIKRILCGESIVLQKIDVQIRCVRFVEVLLVLLGVEAELSLVLTQVGTQPEGKNLLECVIITEISTIGALIRAILLQVEERDASGVGDGGPEAESTIEFSHRKLKAKIAREPQVISYVHRHG